MAVIKESILGEINGKVGDIVYKKRNGKTYISKAAASYTVSQLPQEKVRRDKQRINGKICSLINKNIHLCAAWKKKKAPCFSGYNRMNKVNFHLCEPDRPSERLKITPGGFKLAVEEIRCTAARVKVLPRPIRLKKGEDAVTFIMVLSLWNKRSKVDDDFEFLLMEAQQPDSGAGIIFKFKEEESASIKKYKNKTIYLAAVTLNKKGDIVRWSETAGRDI